MLFQAVKSEIVSHISYIISSKNEAAVIDPKRNCDVYLEIARRWESKIKYVFETHRNEDYVVGSVELAKATGARVFHGPGLSWGYGETLSDGQEFNLGLLKIKAFHTPGHSPESTCYVVYDGEADNHPVMVFTGDTLFVGDVGRTDFLGVNMTPVMSEKMYDSIVNRLLPLGDGVIVYPAHGAGSICGGKISEREVSTIGIEKATNPMLKLSREEFVAHKISEKHETPPYFKQMEVYNLEGPPLLGSMAAPIAMKPSEFNEKIKNGAYVVDVRTPVAFGGGHIPGSFSLPPSRLSLAGWVLSYDKPILLVADAIGTVDFAVRNLVQLGFDRIEGYLANGLESWYKEGLPLAKLSLLTVHELNRLIDSGADLLVLDVRRKNEWDEGHISGATRIYVGHLEKEAGKLPKNKPIVTICKTGNRSSFGASLLLRAGLRMVYNCLGGMDAWIKSGYLVARGPDKS